MIRHRCRSVVGIAALAATIGCDSGQEPSPSPSATSTSAPQGLCAPAVASGETLVAAFSTNVGEVRAETAGPGVRPAASFAPERGDSDPAAWCWIDSADGTQRRVVARVASGEQTTFVTGNPRGLSPNPDGPQVP